MKLFDPQRPRNSHQQAELLTGGLIPTWHVLPGGEAAEVKIMVFLLVEGINTYRDYSFLAQSAALAELWQEWLDGPEQFAQSRWSYTGPRQRQQAGAEKAIINASLEDLGL